MKTLLVYNHKNWYPNLRSRTLSKLALIRFATIPSKNCGQDSAKYVKANAGKQKKKQPNESKKFEEFPQKKKKNN